jgi:hypothetical protein
VDDADRANLDRAIAAHCEWLEHRGIRFVDPQSVLRLREEREKYLSLTPEQLAPSPLPEGLVDTPPPERLALPLPPEDLVASDVMGVVSMRAPEKLTGAVLANVHVFCSLRTRVGLSKAREEAVKSATNRAVQAPDPARTEMERQLKLVAFVHDESHIRALEPSLSELEKRLRTGARKLKEFVRDLEKRHRTFSEMGALAISSADIALAGWMVARSEALERDLAFYRLQVQGQHFAEHKEPVDGKAWNPVLNAALLALKEAGMRSAERKALFPGCYPKTTDPDVKRLHSDRENKARSRAKRRARSSR